MSGTGPTSLGARARPGLIAGGTVGLLTGFCFVLLFGGLDFSGGNPLAALLRVSSGMLALCAGLVAVGAAAGVVVSLKTSDD